jgi:hypothetical protein
VARLEDRLCGRCAGTRRSRRVTQRPLPNRSRARRGTPTPLPRRCGGQGCLFVPADVRVRVDPHAPPRTSSQGTRCATARESSAIRSRAGPARCQAAVYPSPAHIHARQGRRQPQGSSKYSACRGNRRFWRWAASFFHARMVLSHDPVALRSFKPGVCGGLWRGGLRRRCESVFSGRAEHSCSGRGP